MGDADCGGFAAGQRDVAKRSLVTRARQRDSAGRSLVTVTGQRDSPKCSRIADTGTGAQETLIATGAGWCLSAPKAFRTPASTPPFVCEARAICEALGICEARCTSQA
mmetsp:Transcript_16594/g.38948  ORF Transcript_16594/g.38948 Transcript_16594/m.38948 type:complete len:108 (+) Transcript_16594:1171-1494(+)